MLQVGGRARRLLQQQQHRAARGGEGERAHSAQHVQSAGSNASTSSQLDGAAPGSASHDDGSTSQGGGSLSNESAVRPTQSADTAGDVRRRSCVAADDADACDACRQRWCRRSAAWRVCDVTVGGVVCFTGAMGGGKPLLALTRKASWEGQEGVGGRGGRGQGR
jgi:hypothetical protein